MADEKQVDDVARRVRGELIEIAVDQISKPIAHEFDIRIALDEESGANTVLVTASSRSVRPVSIHVRVDVRTEADGLVIERDGGVQQLDVVLADAHPRITESLHRRMSDFVATCIASAISQLNAEMQRRIGRP